MSIFFIKYAITLIYGIWMTFIFGAFPLKENKKKILTITGLLLVIELILAYLFGINFVLKTYPVHTHLLLMLYLVLVYKINAYCSIMYVLMAYMSCQIPAWFSAFSRYIFPENEMAETIVYFVFALITALAFGRVVGDSARALLEGGRASKISFGLIPITYYLFDYSTTFWTDLLYSGNYHITQFIPLVLCMGYPVLIIGYRGEQKKRLQAEQNRLIIEGNLNMVESEIESIREIEKMSKIYRHDMRHHLTLLLAMIQGDKLEQATSYIKEAIQAVEEITPVHYCDIEILNLLLMHFGKIADEEHITYSFEVSLNGTLKITDMEICALVSNALENACNACMDVPEDRRRIDMVFKEHQGMLAFSVENTCQTDLIINGIAPNADWYREHGFGTQSMEAIAVKYDGSVRQVAKDGTYSLMVILCT